MKSHFESLYPSDTRFAELEKLVGFIKEGNSAQLISLPGVGRSTILRLLAYNRAVRIKHLGEKQNYFHFVLLNFAEIRNRPLFDATKFIFLTLLESMKDRAWQVEYKKSYEIFRESLELQDELVLFQGLKRAIEFLAIEKKSTIVLLFDRFEEYLPMITPAFFTNLRLLRDHAKYHFSVLFSLNRPLDMLIEPSSIADFYEFVAGHSIFISLFDKPGLAFRLKYLEETTGKAIDKSLADAIFTLTSGHGKLTRVCLEGAVANNLTPQSLASTLLSYKTVKGALFEIWYSLTPAEQKYILSLSDNNNEQKEVNKFLNGLHLLDQNKITIPLFEQFIQSETSLREFFEEKITYEEITNEIKKGEQTISDQLTSAEFRFLKFMLQNQDRVCERDEIINAVWTDTKTSQGVSNEALDQVVYRLRKKIEQDPNNPQHLVTVKGRGYRLVP